MSSLSSGTLNFPLRKEHKLIIFVNRTMRRIFKPKEKKLTAGYNAASVVQS
jgi:hypothetical protein